jgi:hypothetical protein
LLVSFGWWMAGKLGLEIGDRLRLLVGDHWQGVVWGEPLRLALGNAGAAGSLMSLDSLSGGGHTGA